MAESMISRDDLGDYLRRDLGSDDAALIAVDAASDIVRTATEQAFAEVEDEDIVLDGTGSDVLLLPELPVTDVTAVEVDGEAVTSYTWTKGGMLFAPWGKRWKRGRQNITVTYTHGYTTADFPADIRLVALAIAARIYEGALLVKNENTGGYAVNYMNDLTGIEKLVIDKYRRNA